MNDGALAPEESRRSNLNRIVELGIDPWGHRFNDRDMIGDILQRTGEIKFVTESGDSLELPTAEQLGDRLAACAHRTPKRRVDVLTWAR